MSGPSGRPVLAAAVSVVVVATIVAGIVTLGSPTEERARRLDERRLSDLRQLQSAVNFFHSQQKRLPESLEQLAQKRELRVGLDPATKQPYGYRRIDDGHYGLCAIFERSSHRKSPAWTSGVTMPGATVFSALHRRRREGRIVAA